MNIITAAERIDDLAAFIDEHGAEAIDRDQMESIKDLRRRVHDRIQAGAEEREWFTWRTWLDELIAERSGAPA